MCGALIESPRVLRVQCDARKEWLPSKDSNLEREIQNLLCYHYTKGHSVCAHCLYSGAAQCQRAGQ
jgi:hypothetical protein